MSARVGVRRSIPTANRPNLSRPPCGELERGPQRVGHSLADRPGWSIAARTCARCGPLGGRSSPLLLVPIPDRAPWRAGVGEALGDDALKVVLGVERHEDRGPPAEREVSKHRPAASSATISPSSTQSAGSDPSSASNRCIRLPRFDSMRPSTVSAIARKPSNFSSKVHSGRSKGLAPSGGDNWGDGHAALIPTREPLTRNPTTSPHAGDKHLVPNSVVFRLRRCRLKMAMWRALPP
jgi:hypothetical protein